jgi:hypothetical protein
MAAPPRVMSLASAPSVNGKSIAVGRKREGPTVTAGALRLIGTDRALHCVRPNVF